MDEGALVLCYHQLLLSVAGLKRPGNAAGDKGEAQHRNHIEGGDIVNLGRLVGGDGAAQGPIRTYLEGSRKWTGTEIEGGVRRIREKNRFGEEHGG